MVKPKYLNQEQRSTSVRSIYLTLRWRAIRPFDWLFIIVVHPLRSLCRSLIKNLRLFHLFVLLNITDRSSLRTRCPVLSFLSFILLRARDLIQATLSRGG